MFKSFHFVPIMQCWQLREDSWGFSFSVPSLQYRRDNNLKENWDGKWVDFFFFFLLLFPRCKFYPTKSKHFCLADKCARGESKSCIQQDKTTHTNKIEGAMRAKQQQQKKELGHIFFVFVIHKNWPGSCKWSLFESYGRTMTCWETMSLGRPGNTSRFLWRSWWKSLGRGVSGPPCWGWDPHGPDPYKSLKDKKGLHEISGLTQHVQNFTVATSNDMIICSSFCVVVSKHSLFMNLALNLLKALQNLKKKEKGKKKTVTF